MNKLTEFVNEAHSIAISGHIRPDGDCVGSCLGLYHYLKENYPKKEVALYLESIPEAFHFLSGTGEIESAKGKDQVYDLFVLLDSGSIDRLEDARPMFELAVKNICIDHHISNTGFGMESIVNIEKSSTAELLYSLMEREKIPKETAMALYFGMVHDTGVFKHSNTTPDTMRAAADLLELGASTEVIDKTFYQKTYLQNQILGRCLLESFLMLKKQLIVSCIDKKTLDFYGVASKDLDGIIDQLRVTSGVECALFAYEVQEGEYKVSLRSNHIVDVSKIAVYFGGGGHVRAAGCQMKGSYHDVVNNIAGHIENQINRTEME